MEFRFDRYHGALAHSVGIGEDDLIMEGSRHPGLVKAAG